MTRASLWRRLGALLYEGLLLMALLLVIGFALLPLVSPPQSLGPPSSAPEIYRLGLPQRAFSFAALVIICGAYFAWLWSDGRRTLAMKTWRLALRVRGGSPVSMRRAWLRYAATWIGPALALLAYVAVHSRHSGSLWTIWLVPLNFFWAIVDRDRQFLHDRIAGTELVKTERTADESKEF